MYTSSAVGTERFNTALRAAQFGVVNYSVFSVDARGLQKEKICRTQISRRFWCRTSALILTLFLLSLVVWTVAFLPIIVEQGRLSQTVALPKVDACSVAASTNGSYLKCVVRRECQPIGNLSTGVQTSQACIRLITQLFLAQ